MARSPQDARPPSWACSRGDETPAAVRVVLRRSQRQRERRRFAGVRPHAERPNERRTTTRTASAQASEPREPVRTEPRANAERGARQPSPEASLSVGSDERMPASRAPSARWRRDAREPLTVRAEAVGVRDAERQAVRVCFQRSLGRSRAGERADPPAFALTCERRKHTRTAVGRPCQRQPGPDRQRWARRRRQRGRPGR